MHVFVADYEKDGFFSDEAKMLADRLGDLETCYMFQAEDGTGEHYAAGATVLQIPVVLDWFEVFVSEKSQSLDAACKVA